MLAKSTFAWMAVLLFAGTPLEAQDSLGGLSRQGNDLIAKKLLPEAEKFFRGAVAQARAASDKAWEAEFERAIGETYERRFEYGNAKTHYQRSLEIRLEMPGAEENRKQIARL
ncbi:MAG: tetratricopeptide repeat protein, partial [Acidobacteria bacterium]|nr:tetratricopeptide repeat protein [Acidobacteriota bacterium]